jgi:hypothetical protein
MQEGGRVGRPPSYAALSPDSIGAFQKVAEMIPEDVPIILESTIAENEIDSEIERVLDALPVKRRLFAAQ